MPNVEIHGHGPELSPVADCLRTQLRKHLKHHPIGKDCVITIVNDCCTEVMHSQRMPFLRVFITQDDDIETLLPVITSCPFADISHTYDIEVVELHSFHAHKE